MLITPESDVTALLPCPLCWKLFFNGSVQAMDLGFTTTCAAVTRDWPDVKLNFDANNSANRRGLARNVNGKKTIARFDLLFVSPGRLCLFLSK